MAKQSIEAGKPLQDYRFFCINAPINDYKMCWLINNTLNLQLKRVDDIAIDEHSLQTFSCYKQESELLNYILIALKNEQAFLFKDFNQFDYIFGVISHEENIVDVHFSSLLAGIQNVVYVSKMSDQAKQYELLRYLTELH